MSERLRQGLQQRKKREKGSGPAKGKDQAEREKLSQTHCLKEGHRKCARQPQGSKRIVRQRPKPHPKEKSPSPKDNLLTGGRTEQVDLEADLQSREHNGENQELPKTRSFSEDHPERGRQRLQGAKLSHRPRHKPQPAETRVGYKDNPRPVARVGEATLNPNMGQ